jgi:hypothetical protein
MSPCRFLHGHRSSIYKPEWPEALNGPPAKRFRGTLRSLSKTVVFNAKTLSNRQPSE